MPDLMKLMEDWNGYALATDIVRPEGYERKLTEVIDLLSNAKGLPAHKHEYLLREALTTSDFPLLFGDVLDRQMLAAYKATPPVWKPYTKLSTVPRILPQVGGYRFAMRGGDEHLDRVFEKGEYLASDRNADRYAISVGKYGRQFDISWEAMINDDLNALKDTPVRFAMAAQRTEHRIVVGQYAWNRVGAPGTAAHATDTTGLYSSFVGEDNRTGALLTINNLEIGLGLMASRTDVAGEPIFCRAKFLVVPPALELTARQILTSTEKMWITGVAAAVPYPTKNVVAQYGLQLIVDPYLPAAASAAGSSVATESSQWYLFSDPNDIRVIEAAHLSGHERPEICMKASNKVTVGGGAINPMSGDFATDNIFYRVRLVFGATILDWRGAYMGGDQN
ncbi:hypothetical protein ES703_39601 [subsurface metagenome]